MACVGGGSNAMGIFTPSSTTPRCASTAWRRAATEWKPADTAAPLTAGRVGVLHGNRTYLMADSGGQIIPTHSVSAGLDLPRSGARTRLAQGLRKGPPMFLSRMPKRSPPFTASPGRRASFPALESSHALAFAERLGPEMNPDDIIIVNLSGRGDKDVPTVASLQGMEL